MGKVYLIGAGPGDPKLISVKGMEKLAECEVLIYDRLASDAFLDYVSSDCIKRYVGKEAGKHSKKQEEINEILVEYAQKYEKVVRLKGGDSFVFGRGGEEIEALSKYGISYEVIPGISSAIAVPESAGIPVTHRGVSRSFHVITGHTNTKNGILEYDFENLAKCEGTLIFLMGFSNLDIITERLIQAGKDKKTPVAVISKGTTILQKVVRGTLEDIILKTQEAKIAAPAIIVIGETAKYEFKKKTQHIKIGMIGTKALKNRVNRVFEDDVFQIMQLCNMEVIPNNRSKELLAALHSLEVYQWILFTSQNAVQIFFEAIQKEEIDIRKFANVKFAVLGSGTAEQLKKYGFFADFIPSEYTVVRFAEEFVKVVQKEEKVLIPRAKKGSPKLLSIFQREHISFQEIVLYDVKGRITENIKYIQECDYLIFLSASGVCEFFQGLKERDIALPEKIKIACIGEVTSSQLYETYGKADVVATVSNVPGLRSAILEDSLKQKV